MEFLKKQPFMAGIAAAAVLVLLVGGYLVFTQSGRLGAEQMIFEEKTMLLGQLEANEPFPDQANVESAQKETKRAAELLAGLGEQFAVDPQTLGPQEFQDELNKAVRSLAEKAAEKGVSLGDDFYLGFENYETQPPAAELATALGVQLRAIQSVAAALIDSQISSIEAVSRTPLPGETSAAPADSSAAKTGPEKTEPPTGLQLAPFQIGFTASQASFRLAFNRILELTPPVFVRLVAITNSMTGAPSKAEEATAEGASTGEAEAGEIKAVLGRESLSVILRLASISADGKKH